MTDSNLRIRAMNYAERAKAQRECSSQYYQQARNEIRNAMTLKHYNRPFTIELANARSLRAKARFARNTAIGFELHLSQQAKTNLAGTIALLKVVQTPIE